MRCQPNFGPLRKCAYYRLLASVFVDTKSLETPVRITICTFREVFKGYEHHKVDTDEFVLPTLRRAYGSCLLDVQCALLLAQWTEHAFSSSRHHPVQLSILELLAYHPTKLLPPSTLPMQEAAHIPAPVGIQAHESWTGRGSITSQRWKVGHLGPVSSYEPCTAIVAKRLMIADYDYWCSLWTV